MEVPLLSAEVHFPSKRIYRQEFIVLPEVGDVHCGFIVDAVEPADDEREDVDFIIKLVDLH